MSATPPEAHAEAPSSPRLIVVAGSGRSGTSLFTGLSSRLGAYVPKPEVEANKSNPRGFSEPRWAVEFHKELLTRVNVAVEDTRPDAWEITGALADDADVRAQLRAWLEEQFAISDTVIVKDPRLTWFLDLYRRVGDELGSELSVVTMLREPAEVLKSRELAYGTKTGTTTRIACWVNLMLSTERRGRADDRSFVRYTDLLSDWRPTLERVDGALDWRLFERATEAQVADADDLVDPNLRRSSSSLEDLGISPQLQEFAQRVYDGLNALADEVGGESEQTLAALDDLHDEFLSRYEEAQAFTSSSTRAVERQVRRNTRRRVRKELEEQGLLLPGATDHPGSTNHPGGTNRTGEAAASDADAPGLLDRLRRRIR